MRYEVTLDTLQQTALDLQSGGSGFNTVLGMALVTAVASDAFFGGLGRGPISGLLLELTTLKVPYRVVFFATVMLQAGLLYAGLRALRSSRWPSSTSQTALAPMWASLRAGRPLTIGPRAVDRGAVVAGVFVGALVVAALMALALASALSAEDAVPIVRWGTLAAMLALAVLLALVISTLTLVCVADLQVLLGASAGLVAAGVAAAYGGGGGRFAGALNDLAYWETGMLAVTGIGMLIFMWGSRSTKNVLVLNLPDGVSAPLYREYSPFSAHIIRPASLMCQVHGTKLLAFSRADKAPSYDLIDTRNEQLATSLHDRSIKFLNISALANQVRTAFDITDSGGYFALRGSVGLLATTVSFKQAGAQTFDRAALEVIADVLFTNEDLRGLLSRPVTRALEKYVGPMRDAIADIRATIKQLPEAMSLGGSGTDYTTALRTAIDKERSNQRVDGLQSASLKRDGRQRLGSAFLQVIDEQLKRFNDIRSSLERSAGSLQDVWVAEILEELRVLAQSHDQDPATLREVGRLLNVLGLRLNDLRLELIGPAAQCQEELSSLRGEIERRFHDAESQFETQSGKRDDLLADAVRTLIGNRSLRPAEIASLLSALSSGVPMPPTMPAPGPSSQVDFDPSNNAQPPESPT